jgi:glycosidase
MKGTPFIYQGEEIGMTNVRFSDLSSYRDIETFQMYKERIQKGYTHEEIMASIYAKGRDNARTPMQWDQTEHAGFTTGVPWISVNPNYIDINVEIDLQSDRSIYRYYQQLIRLRKKEDIVVYGDYQLLETEPQIYAYTRQLGNELWYIICNFTDETVECKLLNQLPSGELVLNNYQKPFLRGQLRPYESIIWKTRI